jgi:pimeloyl-ACP methyl ester carboxylesterase
VGHSFGGKVALEASRLGVLKAPGHVVVLDSAPGVHDAERDTDGPLEVLTTIESMPDKFASKADFINAVAARGHTRELAKWLAGSLDRKQDGVRFMLDLDEIRALVADYDVRDLWPFLENPPVHVHLVIAQRSKVWTPSDRERALRIADTNPRVTVDVLDAGHWLHIDSPDEVLARLLEYLR